MAIRGWVPATLRWLLLLAISAGCVDTAVPPLQSPFDPDFAPTTLVYAPSPVVATKGEAIANATPSAGGGFVLSYAVTPPLPAGLALDTTTGVISGVPSALSPKSAYTITATNNGGATSTTLPITVNDVAPSALAYPTNPLVCTKGQPIATDTPSGSGGAVVSYSITPALPAGLALDETTGIISGTPAVLSPATTYTVTATNSGGSATTMLSVTVNDAAPSELTYSANPAVYTLGQAITPDTTSSSGGPVLFYGIAPDLPAGLIMDVTTGSIQGTPNVLSSATTYTVTATNSGGSATVLLSIAVNDVPPSELTYSAAAIVDTLYQAITNDTPSSTGGPVVSYAISPPLPTGLAIDPMAGIISGTPTEPSPATDYTVTATNSGGFTTATVNITVTDIPPTGLTYSTNPAVYLLNEQITDNAPSGTGGPVVSYEIAPPLPTGLDFNTTTGIISGTPEASSSATNYTVTATNPVGMTTALLSITVIPVLPPSVLTYSVNPAVYTVGATIVTDTPSSSGGPVESYAITPPLPMGLSLDTTTGFISGTPTALSSATTYTVTATNGGGATTVTLTITVNNLPPSGLVYSTNPAVYTIGQAIADNMPSNGGGAVVSYSISSAPPSGLGFDTQSGVISGTPTELSATTVYTVTASNSAGWTTVALSIAVIESCEGTAPTQVCGNCGTQSETCNAANGTWTGGWGACTGEGVCAPNVVQSCAGGGLQTCSDSCEWGQCMSATCSCNTTDGCTNCPSAAICDLSDVCAAPQYTINGDGTVTDNVTGLVWQQTVPANPCPSDGTGVCTWEDAQTYCESLDLGGYSSGWQLPTLAQLFSLVDMNGSGPPYIDTTVFANTPLSWFWTSVSASDSYNAWIVDFFVGYTLNLDFGDDGNVRCVR